MTLVGHQEVVGNLSLFRLIFLAHAFVEVRDGEYSYEYCTCILQHHRKTILIAAGSGRSHTRVHSTAIIRNRSVLWKEQTRREMSGLHMHRYEERSTEASRSILAL